MHVETIGFQKETVIRVLKSILPRIEKDLHSIELRLVPILTYLAHKKMASRLEEVTIKHIHISSNIKTHEIDIFNNIDSKLFPGSELTLRKLIMDIKAEDSERFTVTMTRDWKNAMEL